ncbi:MAG: transcription antitermination factor NusB [Planctomycetota bacterium]
MTRLAKEARNFPDLGIQPLETDGLDAREAAFAHALYDIVLRRWITIRYLCEGLLTRAWHETDPRARAVLLAGVAQILFMDGVPVHAAVDESVGWAKAQGGHNASRMINAVLRRVSELRDPEEPERAVWSDRRDELPHERGGAIALTQSVLPDDGLRRLSIATSHPLELLRTWVKTFGMGEAKRIALHGLTRPPTIFNTAHARDPLPEGVLEAHDVVGHHVFVGEGGTLGDLLRSRDDIWVQDPASSLAVESVVDLTPGLIVDACAGRGTKTRQLARTFPSARIVAADVDGARARSLRETFAHSEQVRVVPFESLDEWNGKADLVLLDVPCSNTGVLGRRPEARYRYEKKRQEGLAGVQRQIIADALRLIWGDGPRGKLLYSTCSLEPSENEEQAVWADRWHSLGVSREHRRVPSGGPGMAPRSYTDGSFAALLG